MKLTNWHGILTCTNLVKPEPRGDPLYKAMDAPFNSVEYIIQGPIIHPRLVGKATISPFRTSMWLHASAAAFKGVARVHGIAFGSPTPENSVGHTYRQTLWKLYQVLKLLVLN